MVNKVMPVYKLDFSNRDDRGATDDNRRKPQRNIPFKEILARELAGTAKLPVSRK